MKFDFWRRKTQKEWWDFINKGLRRKKRSEGKIQFDGVEENRVADILNRYFAEAWTSNTSSSPSIFPLPRPTGETDLCSIGLMKRALTELDPRKAFGIMAAKEPCWRSEPCPPHAHCEHFLIARNSSSSTEDFICVPNTQNCKPQHS